MKSKHGFKPCSAAIAAELLDFRPNATDEMEQVVDCVEARRPSHGDVADGPACT